MDKQNVVYPGNRVFFSHKKKKKKNGALAYDTT